MQTCNQCGDEIEFRYVDGVTTPIHVNGRWCTGASPQIKTAKGWFRSREAFTDPNALCPVCGESVFYYQNKSGSRVFFDDLGWPWPKHRCTDNPVAQSSRIKRPRATTRRVAGSFANPTTLYELDGIKEANGQLEIRFRNIANRQIVRTLRFPLEELHQQGWEITDLQDAPSFVIRKHPHEFSLRFISVRRGKIGTLLIPIPLS